MALGKRMSTTEPLTDHDVADRPDKTRLRLWPILPDLWQMGPEFKEAVRTSRYLTNCPIEARDALTAFLAREPIKIEGTTR